MSEKKKEIVKVLTRIADLLEFKGENQFKIKAYRNGASAIKKFEGDISELVSNENPVKIKGVGKGILSVIKDYLENGFSRELEKLSEEIPEKISELFEIKGLGIKKIRALYENLGIASVDDLKSALENGKLAESKILPDKTLEKIEHEIKKFEERGKFFLLNEAEQIAEEVKTLIKKNIASVKKIEVSGELRRVREIISKIEFVVLREKGGSENFEKELGDLFRFEKSADTISTTDADIYELGNFAKRSVYLYVTESKSDFVKINFLRTGNDEFIGAFNLEEEFNKEREIFEKNSYEYCIPEVREQKPQNISARTSDLCFGEMKGMLHFHTVWSDGHNSLEEMVRAGKELGFEYFAVCDHSKSAYYANGLNEERLSEQKKLVAEISEKHGVTIMHGNEVDILPDGSLDFPEDVLASLDFVVASVHSNFRLSEAEMTSRIIKAVKNPYINVLGHPTGRLLLRRDPYAVNILKVIDACAANNVAIEINANPWRLDLDWRNLDYARKRGAIFSINADAHSTGDIAYTKLGVKIARKGGVNQSEVINYWDINRLREFIASKR